MQFGPVEPERLHTDQHLAALLNTLDNAATASDDLLDLNGRVTGPSKTDPANAAADWLAERNL